MIKNQKIFVLWLILVVLWNFGVPEAEPIYDVIVAIVLSFFSIFLNNKL
tara:strand:- start:638 stop:784 length:147 start_codon:yes stop_codon:yes gene_type:complete